MEIWYVESKSSQNLTQPFENWLSKNVSKVIIEEGMQQRSFFADSDIVIFNEKKPLESKLSESFACSLSLANKVIESLNSSSDTVCILINNNDKALPYFLLQNFWCKHPALNNAVIITIQNNIGERHDVYNYKFPEYWENSKNAFSLKASHFIITWNKSVYGDLKNKEKVIYLDQENSISLDLTQWLEKKKMDKFYPISSSIPYEKSDDTEAKADGLLTVIIPYYNMGSMILETLQSVSESTYQKIEIIIVNDGSDDVESLNVLEIIERTMPFIKVLHIDNGGLSNARNIGALEAKGRYISFLDSDDLIKSEYYQRCITILESYENISFVYSWVQFFGLKDDVWITFDTEFPMLLLTNMLSAFAVIKKEHFLNYGINKLEMKQGMEDYESWINMCKNGCAGVSIPEPLVNYRIRSNSMSRQFNRKIVNELYHRITQFHKELYKEHGDELFNLVYANGPGYMWNNPAASYPGLGYVENQDLDNNVKYELMRIFNSKTGKIIIKLFLKLKINKWFK